MDLSGLAGHFGAGFGVVAGLAVMIRCGFDAILRLIAAIVAIAARDKRPRADRALEVLRLLSSERRSRRG